MNRDNKPWFAPKRYGIGAGLPIAWQGWALMIAYIVIVSVTAPFAMLIPYFLYHNWWIATPPFIGVMLIETGVFMVICARKTRGGWRWRWGSDE
jgi:hypothetical protein